MRGHGPGVVGTWLGVGVIHRVAIQLQKFLRLRLLLPVTAHGEGVLTHLGGGGKQSVRLGPESTASWKKPSPWKHVLVPEALCSGAGLKPRFIPSRLSDVEPVT